MHIIDRADTNFDRFEFAVVKMGNGAEALVVKVLCRTSKAVSQRTPLESTIKQHFDHKGFFASAVLRRYNSAQGGVTARSKSFRRMHGTLLLSPDNTEGANKRSQLCIYWMQIRAVADTDNYLIAH